MPRFEVVLVRKVHFTVDADSRDAIKTAANWLVSDNVRVDTEWMPDDWDVERIYDLHGPQPQPADMTLVNGEFVCTDDLQAEKP